MTRRPALDVSELPRVVLGHRDPLWWGVVGLMAIESTVFALTAVTYFYLRGGADVWPPPGSEMPLAVGNANLIALLISVLPMHLVNQHGGEGRMMKARVGLIVATALGIISLVLRCYEFGGMTFRYNSHAYGSIVWTIFGLHTLHLLTSVGENTVFLVLLFKGPIEDKHRLDVRLNGLYWYFVVASWVFLYSFLYWDPGLFRR
jgi:heme/copper-type cytochrome/quinol oxidase subunit 3